MIHPFFSAEACLQAIFSAFRRKGNSSSLSRSAWKGISRAVFHGALLFFATQALAQEPELHPRAGLPNLAARSQASAGELRVAYLGGSITAAGNGWRSLTTAHLQILFPMLTIVEISAGLPGTGSDLGACRLERDVLRHQPDLLFVEFAVNDTNPPPERIERTMEGIVRQTWRANPHTDICFVYTISTPGLSDLQAGNFQPSARTMEKVAAHYGIPTVHFGIEIARRVTEGRLVFKKAATPDAATPAPAEDAIFSLDGVHPTAASHRIYFSVLERALTPLLAHAGALPHPLPPPLHADNWEHASLRLMEDLTRQGDWTELALDDPNLRGATKALLPPIWRAATPGAAVEFEFTGRRFGLLGISAPDSGEFRVTVDDQSPLIATFFDAYASPTFCRAREWFYPTELANGTHRVRIELLDTSLDKAAIKAKAGKPIDDPQPYAAHRLTLGGVLIIGTPAP